MTAAVAKIVDTRRNVDGLFHYLDSSCSVEELNFSRTLA